MKLDIVRAWKDETYRQTLSQEQLSTLPANPAGELELTDACLNSVCGGGLFFSIIKLSKFTFNSINIVSSPVSQTCVFVR